MEKLSSGFRINRAGDDAAGLAISEKMRGQIRGLTQASRNSQDTISLIQTAEGALSETHAILQRMRELAVQAANDTNTDADRFEIQSEIKQLKAEVDRIGNTTEFNTKKLLEGSARGISEEVAGAFRINNNSGIVINSDDQKAMLDSIANDKSWAFDGAYMIVKNNQTKSGDVAIYNANDFMLVGPDGKTYSFVEAQRNQQVEASNLKANTIIADGGARLVAGTSGQTASSTISASITAASFSTSGLVQGAFVLGEAVNNTVISVISGTSALASGSSVTIRGGSSITLNSSSTGLASAGISGTLGANSITYTNTGEMQLLGGTGGTSVMTTIEVGRSVTLDNGTTIRNDGGGTFTVTNGSLGVLGGVSSGNASAFTISSQSVLCSSSTIANPSSTVLVQASNYQVSTAGAFNANVTIGNSTSLGSSNITSVKAGTVLANGSDVTIRVGQFITLNVNGKDVEVSYASSGTGTNAGTIMKVGDQIVAAGKSITLADGTVLTNSSTLQSASTETGKITVTSGSVTLGKDINEVNTSGYNIAKDSTIAAGSRVAAGTVLMAGTVITEAGTNFAGSVTLAHNGTSMQFSANAGASLEAKYHEAKVGESMTFVFGKYVAASNSINDSVMAQVGANSGQTSWISMGDMRSAALGIDKVDISTRWGAVTGIETINNALQAVSHQRSSLGAMQNRLEHTIKNLDTAAENLQASESRIRDVDMAREIMEYTKNTILQQASQAMLAQANQAPQSIMQLLR
jgi:flagellin